ncbi:GNAT family N-acetyltransferase [Vibrio sp. 10N.286.49.C2]|uniref:GNAT family N-acetyltransferase n=1 Tax=unclassified Vibrio TaxID=2614977 RepID=UPI000C856F6B|nr:MULTISPECIES: GNAT family N-acetyltransferase [unclassified Vibrio]PMH39284.1 GNAT family N-acetyltransferase [Vibrio sp. 10N.286.49.C2]PMH54368.1 GNAT family N-acetyltransferase [Vibrio sp. 10N.286.49.B1]PMH78461.1 GNAT family N-acetyltransferase [Vibrio sp. 10N.286.48.B7]
MDIQPITTAEVLPIRHQVLWPNKSPSFCEVEGDEYATHYGAFVGGKLVCVASVYRNADEARLRKFATLSEYQGQGIGTKVIERLVCDLQLATVRYFWCDARTSAVSFYQHFGLRIEGDEFQKSGVSYFKMSVSWG